MSPAKKGLPSSQSLPFAEWAEAISVKATRLGPCLWTRAGYPGHCLFCHRNKSPIVAHMCLCADKHTLSCALLLHQHFGFSLTRWHFAEPKWPWQREPSQQRCVRRDPEPAAAAEQGGAAAKLSASRPDESCGLLHSLYLLKQGSE